MSKKHSKNLQKVQDMLDGKGTGKIQSGYTAVEEIHKVGDTWTDSDGKKWEQKNGYRSNVTKLANKGLGNNCSECKKFIIKLKNFFIPWFNNKLFTIRTLVICNSSIC